MANPPVKLLVLTPMLAHALSSRSWSRVVLEREGRKDAVRSEPSIVFGVPAGYAGGWYGCIHVSHCGCVHVGHGQQKVRCKYGWDGHVTSARRESDCLDCLCKVGSLAFIMRNQRAKPKGEPVFIIRNQRANL